MYIHTYIHTYMCIYAYAECLEKRQGASGKEISCVGGAGVAGAIEDFSRQRAPEARALVKLSREFDRPGITQFTALLVLEYKY